jgi:hypothetical protein
MARDKKMARDEFVGRMMKARTVWTVRNLDGMMGAEGVDGSSAQPFWSSRDRAERMVEEAAPAASLSVVEIPLGDFVHSLGELAAAGVLVGIDWQTDHEGWVCDAKEMHSLVRTLIHRLN